MRGVKLDGPHRATKPAINPKVWRGVAIALALEAAIVGLAIAIGWC